MQIYLQSPITTQIQVFDNENQIGVGFVDWNKLNEMEILQYELEKAKQNKLSELQSIYLSNKTWQFTLKDVDGTLTQTSDWLLAKISTTPIFYDDKGSIVKKTFTVNEVFEIIDKINAKGFETLTTKKAITTKINSAQKIADIENIDIQSEFEKINKIIEIT